MECNDAMGKARPIGVAQAHYYVMQVAQGQVDKVILADILAEASGAVIN
ncbi:hypothetical protein [Leptolyngbya sp. KIOST-1]|nr:hypothetical protein [Leptolyngbya sp. KIOST-1]